MLRMSPIRLVFAVAALALMAGLAGCKKQPTAHSTPAEVVSLPPTRPEALSQAEREIRAGQAKEAEAHLRGWVSANADSPYRPEAQYLLGQALFSQGDYQNAKTFHDEVIKGQGGRVLTALALFGRADCNFKLADYREASRQYHWLEQFYRDVSAVPHDELLFKLGLCCKFAGFPETADYWFDKVIELYGTSNYAEEARQNHSRLGPGKTGEPTFYSLEVASFSDEKRALAEAQAYKDKGYGDVTVREVAMFGTSYYSVHIGKYFSKNDAMRAKEDAQLAGINASIRPGWVGIPR
jgi:TolA-binding protein